MSLVALPVVWQGYFSKRGIKLKYIVSSNSLSDIEKILSACTSETEALNAVFALPFFSYGNTDRRTNFYELCREIKIACICCNLPLYVYVFHNQYIYESPFLCKIQRWRLLRNFRELRTDDDAEPVLIDSDVDEKKVCKEIIEKLNKQNFNTSEVFKYKLPTA